MPSALSYKVIALEGERRWKPAFSDPLPLTLHTSFPYSAASPHQDGMPLSLRSKSRDVLKECFFSRHVLQILALRDA